MGHRACLDRRGPQSTAKLLNYPDFCNSIHNLCKAEGSHDFNFRRYSLYSVLQRINIGGQEEVSVQFVTGTRLAVNLLDTQILEENLIVSIVGTRETPLWESGFAALSAGGKLLTALICFHEHR